MKKMKFLVRGVPVLIDYELHQVLVSDECDPDDQLAIIGYLHREGFLDKKLSCVGKEIDTHSGN